MDGLLDGHNNSLYIYYTILEINLLVGVSVVGITDGVNVVGEIFVN